LHCDQEEQDEEAHADDGGGVSGDGGELVEEGGYEGLKLGADGGELLEDGGEVRGEGCVEGGELGGIV